MWWIFTFFYMWSLCFYLGNILSVCIWIIVFICIFINISMCGICIEILWKFLVCGLLCFCVGSVCCSLWDSRVVIFCHLPQRRSKYHYHCYCHCLQIKLYSICWICCVWKSWELIQRLKCELKCFYHCNDLYLLVLLILDHC